MFLDAKKTAYLDSGFELFSKFIVDIAVPYGLLFEPSRRGIEVAFNSLTLCNSSYKFRGHWIEKGQNLFKIALAVTLAAGFIFWFKAANLLNLIVNLSIHSFEILHYANSRDTGAECGAMIEFYRDLTCLTAEMLTGPEIELAVLLICVISDYWEGVMALQRDNYTLAGSCLTRPLLRCYQNYTLPRQIELKIGSN